MILDHYEMFEKEASGSDEYGKNAKLISLCNLISMFTFCIQLTIQIMELHQRWLLIVQRYRLHQEHLAVPMLI